MLVTVLGMTHHACHCLCMLCGKAISTRLCKLHNLPSRWSDMTCSDALCYDLFCDMRHHCLVSPLWLLFRFLLESDLEAMVCRAKLKDLRHSLTEHDVDSLAAAAHGFVGADLAAICNEAAMAALRRIITTAKCPSSAAPAPASGSSPAPYRIGQNNYAQNSPGRSRPSQTSPSGIAAQSTAAPAATADASANSHVAELQVTLADFKVAETRVQPSAMREVGLEVKPCLSHSMHRIANISRYDTAL